MMESELQSRILAQVDRDGIIEMSKEVISIPSPTGQEWEMGRYMRTVFQEMGLAVQWQEVEEGRPNVTGLLEGEGDGPCLMFNGHMDTSYTGQEDHLTGIGFKPYPVVEAGVIYGLGIYNMKGALVCYVHALKAIRQAGLRLNGDVIIAAVTGEIEKSQWGAEFSGAEYRGYGKGSHHLAVHGPTPDMCILGEPTDMKIVTGHYGSLWVRLSTAGPYMHSGFSGGRQGENSIRRMHDVLSDVYRWAEEWEDRAAYGNKKGVVNLGSLRAGHPWRASRMPQRTDVFMDVRVPPTMSMGQARRELRTLVRGLRQRYPDYGIDSEIYVSAPGAEIDPQHEMVQAIADSHHDVVGTTAQLDTVVWGSDASVLTRYGIETVNYGPSSGVRKADGEKVPIDIMVKTTQVYALAIARICGCKKDIT